MIVRKIKPVSPGQRGTILPWYKKLLSQGNKPKKSLTKVVKRDKGRSGGKISMRHRGGGSKRAYRKIDFMYNKMDIPAVVESIEYDPNRTSFISLVCYADGERRYVVTPKTIKVGDKIIVSDKAPLVPGNRMRVKNIPVGTQVYNVELNLNGGAKLGRSAGNYIEVLGYDEKYAQLKMPSGEVRKVPANVFASVGQVSNEVNHLRVEGKAGRMRRKGVRPTVRGSAMAPVAHPYGGGEGKAGRGRRREVTKWGKPAGKGQKTRKTKRYSNSLIVKRRNSGKKSRK